MNRWSFYSGTSNINPCYSCPGGLVVLSEAMQLAPYTCQKGL